MGALTRLLHSRQAIVVSLMTLAFLVSPVTASAVVEKSAVTDVHPVPALADQDHDGVSDDLESEILTAGPDRLFDVIVRTQPGLDPAAVVAASQVRRSLPLINAVAATMVASDVIALAQEPAVTRIEKDVTVQLTDDGTLRDFGAARTQIDLGLSGAGVGICIIDSGVDPNHEQLDQGKVKGWIDYVNQLEVPYDDHDGGHGTHVASIAAGDGAGGPFAEVNRGVAPRADLFVAKAFAGAVIDDIPVLSPGSSQASMVIAAIDWCAREARVDVISMSFTATGPADGTDALSAAVDEAVLTHGKVAVAAAGNDGPNPGFLGSPGVSPNAITVGAVAEWSLPVTAPHRSEGPYLAAFSSRGPTLDGRLKPDVVAPGVSVRAAANNTVAGYRDKDGTSMATPFVAGAIALALEANPALRHADVARLVEATAIDRGPSGKDSDWGAGLVDVYGLASATDGSTLYEPTAFPAHTVRTGSTAVGAPFTMTFELSPDDLQIPIAATIIINGAPDAASGGVFWKPDLQAELLDPNGLLLDRSQCPIGSDPSDCIGNLPNSGRQELLHSLPTVAGTYTIVVSTAGVDAGSFLVDLSHGPVVSHAAPDCTRLFTGGGGDSSWHNPLNWSGMISPLPTDVACIPTAFAVTHVAVQSQMAGLLVNGALTVNGTIEVAGPGPFQVGGQLKLGPGAMVESDIPLDLTGYLTGVGTVVADVENAGDVAPGADIGRLTVDGNYRQTLAGVLRVGVDASGHDILAVTGDTVLNGVLHVTTPPGFDAAAGYTATVIEVSGTRSGEFVSLAGKQPPGGLRWEVDYSQDAPNVNLRLVSKEQPPISGSHVLVCHQPGTPAQMTLELPLHAASAHHRSHGDIEGSCP